MSVTPGQGRTKFDIQYELEGFTRGLMEPPPILEVFQWAEENIYLTERESPGAHGWYNSSLTPYVREPLQCFADKSVSDLTLCWGTQVSKTVTIMIGVCYRLANDPSNMIWVVPNEQPWGRWFASNRWLPMLEGCAPLIKQKPESKSLARSLWKTLEQQFWKVTMSFVGSHSAANLAGRPGGVVIMDEIDKFPEASEKEPGAVDNVEERTKTTPFALHVKTSTPTTADGGIWKEFLAGDQRYYFMPCPHCDVSIRFLWANVKWYDLDAEEAKTAGKWDLRKVRDNAHYKCQECGGKIKDHDKTKMLRAGFWKPTNVDKDGRPLCEEGRRSYHLNSIYAPWVKTTFANLAISWLTSKTTPSKRQKFINSTLAEPWDMTQAYDEEPLATSEYTIKKQANGRERILGVDVQDNEFWVLIREFDPDGENWLIHEGRVNTIEDVRDLQEEFEIENDHVVLDMADLPNRVAKWIVKYGWRGLWGSDAESFIHVLQSGQKVRRVYGPVEQRDPHKGTALQNQGARAKYVKFSKNGLLDIIADLRAENPCRFHIHANVSKDYVKHLNAAMKVVVKHRFTGRSTEKWIIKREDHLLDGECMVRVAAMLLGIIVTEDETGPARAVLAAR